jgi:ATP-dependent exoDNAse (exonuclease V) beta subunit
LPSKEIRAAIVSDVLHAVQDARQSVAWSMLQTGVQAELNVASLSVRDGQAVLTEGIVDAVSRSTDGWIVVDWKVNRSGDALWEQQLPAYQVQAESYVEMLQRRTGVAGVARIERLQSGR